MTDRQTDIFEGERPALLALGYRMLGEWSAAEDLVQEAWLRWAEADHGAISHPAAWLRKVTSRLALDHLRSARVRREQYVGPWLPEPVLDGPVEDADRGIIEAETCELALLWAMERLSGPERLAFVLREAFEAEYAEIAEILDLSQDACRQLVSRSKRALAKETPRFDAPVEEVRGLIERFFAAVMAEDHKTALSLMAADAVAISDGGANVRAARRPLVGPEEIMQVYWAVLEKDRGRQGFSVALVQANGRPAILRSFDGRPDSLFTLAPASDGSIGWIYLMRNPDKLARIAMG